jgi:hypothetical protein
MGRQKIAEKTLKVGFMVDVKKKKALEALGKEGFSDRTRVAIDEYLERIREEDSLKDPRLQEKLETIWPGLFQAYRAGLKKLEELKDPKNTLPLEADVLGSRQPLWQALETLDQFVGYNWEGFYGFPWNSEKFPLERLQKADSEIKKGILETKLAITRVFLLLHTLMISQSEQSRQEREQRVEAEEISASWALGTHTYEKDHGSVSPEDEESKANTNAG